MSSSANWFEVTQMSKGLCRVSIHGLIWGGAEQFIRDIGDAEEIWLNVDSPGGCGWTALQIYDALSKRRTTSTVHGLATSAATLLIAAGRVRAAKNARFVVHAPRIGVLGPEKALLESIQTLREINSRAGEIYAAKTRQPASTIAQWLSGEDRWFTAEEAHTLGLVDEILPEPEPRTDTFFGCSRDSVRGDFPTENETLLLDFLRALGPIQTKDKARLFRELTQWFARNIQAA